VSLECRHRLTRKNTQKFNSDFQCARETFFKSLGFSGSWNVDAESAVLQVVPGKIVFRFHSRDLHFVLAPTKGGKPVRFKVTLDGAPPGENCGGDTARTATVKFGSPGSISSFGNKVQS
jgi:hypothetical protein